MLGYLEINKESHSNFSNKETDEREDEGDQEALAGHEGPAAGQEWESEGDQAGGQDEVGDDGELVPRRLEVEMFRHQQRGPGRGEQDAHHHDEGVDGADAAPEQQVTTPATHSASLSLSLSQLSYLCWHQLGWGTCSPSGRSWWTDTKKAEQL